jgi:predicted alpha/beta hydrolase
MTVSATFEETPRREVRARLGRAAALVDRLLVPGAALLVAGVALGGGLRVALLAATPVLAYALLGRLLPRRLGSALLLLFAVVAGGSGAILGRELLYVAAAAFALAGVRAGWGVNRGLRRRRAWSYRLLSTLAVLPVALYVVVPALQTVNYIGKPREPISDAALGVPHESVTFPASDGVRLAGWFVPGTKDAAMVVVHGGGGDREGAVRHGRMLAAQGYAVLLYDSRGRGESRGDHNAFGWLWDRDVRGAVDYLERRGFTRIGALGLSTGAEAVVTAAASDDRIRAVVADGIQGRQLADAKHLPGLQSLVLKPALAFGALGVRLASGEPLPAPLIGLVHRVAATRPLLLVAGPSFEVEWNRAYAKGTSAELWELPDTPHTRALAERPGEYGRRVASLLAAPLG